MIRRARASLRRSLAVLRKEIGEEALVNAPESVALNLATDLWLDVEQFRSLVRSWKLHGHPEADVCSQCVTALAEAVELYRGDFLAGFSLRNSLRFADWQALETDNLRRELASALHRLVRGHSAHETYERAIGYARRWVAFDPLHEPAHRHLMQAYNGAGQYAAALRQYAECARVLEQELGLPPSEETAALFEQIRERSTEPAGSPSFSPLHGPDETIGAPAPSRPEAARTRLPLQRLAPAVQLEGERRFASVLSAGVVESASLMQQIGMEDWLEVMNRVFEILRTQVYRFGGVVDHFRGGRMVAFFGVPTAHEDDPLRAVLTALAMQDAMVDHAAHLPKTERPDTGRPYVLLLRIGVNSGEVIATTTVDGDRGADDMAIGVAVAMAAGVEKAADPGTVLVGESTYRLVQQLFEWRPLGQVSGEGLATPVAVFRPLAPKAAVGKGRGIPGLESPLVGRDSELHAFRRAVQDVRSGVGGILTLVGEAGIGKSRLVAEVRGIESETEDKGVRWVEGRCLSYGTPIAYHLWLDTLRGLLNVAPDASPSTTTAVYTTVPLADNGGNTRPLED